MSAVTPPRTSVRDAPGPRRQLILPRWAPEAPERRFRRRRLALAAGLLALVLAMAAAAVLLFSGGGETPPATGAAAIVPADALAYVNLSTDPSRPAVARARRLATRFPDWPLLVGAAVSRLDAIVGGSSSAGFAGGIRPWLGAEASLALVPGPGGSGLETLIVLDVARRARAQSFLDGAGARPAGSYAGVRLLAYPSGTQLAFVRGHYLVAGPAGALDAAIDASQGRAPSLVRDGGYARAAAGEPADRVLDAYLPAAGIGRLLAGRSGVLGAIGLLLDRPGVQGAAISLSAGSPGARVLVHSVAGGSASGRAAVAAFKPTLPSILPAGSTLALDVAGLDRAGPELLRAAATAGIGTGIGPLLHRLGSALSAQGVNVRGVLSLFDGETAVAIPPGAAPSLLIVTRVRNEAAARGELAALESPMTTIFTASGSGPGQIPELADQQVGGVTVHELGLGPGLQVDFAVFDGMAVVSTSVSAIDAVAQRSRSLAGDRPYRAVLADRPDQLSSLVFGDFTRLLALGEQTGLESGARTRALLPDLARIRAVGVSSTSRGRDTTTELSVEIP